MCGGYQRVIPSVAPHLVPAQIAGLEASSVEQCFGGLRCKDPINAGQTRQFFPLSIMFSR